MKQVISPSILNCNISQLDREINAISNADCVHVDVMVNHFVPNLSWGLPVVQSVIGLNSLPVDAHLMIEDPDRWAPAYAEAGCYSVTFHAEAATAPLRLARELHAKGARAAIALRPATSIAGILPILNEFDMVLIMTVEPGFGGQAFITQMLDKITSLRKAAKSRDLQLSIQVDGGVTRDNIADCAEAGADNFVAGSAIFKSEDAFQEVARLRKIAQEHACS